MSSLLNAAKDRDTPPDDLADITRQSFENLVRVVKAVIENPTTSDRTLQDIGKYLRDAEANLMSRLQKRTDTGR